MAFPKISELPVINPQCTEVNELSKISQLPVLTNQSQLPQKLLFHKQYLLLKNYGS